MSKPPTATEESCPECEREKREQRGETPNNVDGGLSGRNIEKTSGETTPTSMDTGILLRVPEGMDPETGNYIRGYQPSETTIIVDEPKNDDSGGHFSRNLLMVPPDFGQDTLKMDKECQTTNPLQKGWSRRLASTLSNRTRQWEEDDEDESTGNCIFGKQIRFTIMAISTLCLSSILSNILTFNFTYICMAGEKPENFTAIEQEDRNLGKWEEEEYRELGYNGNLDYSSKQRSLLFMAVAVGALLAVFPLTILLNRYGSRLIFGVLGYVSGVATLLLPTSAYMGFPYIFVIRIVQGATFSACLPVMGSITSHWSTLKQNGIFIAILSSFLQIAPIFTMPISGELCVSRVGWPAVYYLHGIVSLLLFTIFLLYHRNSPNIHPMVRQTELVKVMFNKGGSIYSGPGKESKHSRRVPYRPIYSDIHIWAILVASFGNFMGTQLSLQFMPTYINKVLYMPIGRTGTASAISPIIMFFIKLLAGQSSDRIKFISDEVKLRIYNTLSMGMMGALFITLALLNPHEQPNLCLLVLITSTCILGFNSGGFFKSSQQVSRQHSHFTLANISFLNCVCMLLTPLLNELIAPENAPKNWAIVLWIHGLILMFTNIFFCIFASSKPAPWTLDTFNSSTSTSARRRLKRCNRVKPDRSGGEKHPKRKNGKLNVPPLSA